jgi:hypothetical protein
MNLRRDIAAQRDCRKTYSCIFDRRKSFIILLLLTAWFSSFFTLFDSFNGLRYTLVGGVLPNDSLMG